jgi:hypothetical protein
LIVDISAHREELSDHGKRWCSTWRRSPERIEEQADVGEARQSQRCWMRPAMSTSPRRCISAGHRLLGELERIALDPNQPVAARLVAAKTALPFMLPKCPQPNGGDNDDFAATLIERLHEGRRRQRLSTGRADDLRSTLQAAPFFFEISVLSPHSEKMPTGAATTMLREDSEAPVACVLNASIIP